jgi:hypothetical protein
MIYALIFLYIVPAIHFYREASEDPELMEGLQWTVPVFLWPVMLPWYLIRVSILGPYKDED